jgi:hypothetical protein
MVCPGDFGICKKKIIAMNFKLSLSDIAAWLTTPRPARDWAIAVIFSSALFIACGGYAAYLFIGLRTGSILGTIDAAPAQASTVKKEDIASAVDAYRARADLFAKGVSVPGVFDPSK